VTPILQTLVALAIRIFLGLFLLSKVPLTVCYHLAHVVNVFLLIFISVFLWILLQDSDNLPARIMANLPCGCTKLANAPCAVRTWETLLSRRNRRLWTCRRLRGRACRGMRNVGTELTSRLRWILRCQASLAVRLLTC
jgi:hypothetical protein